MTGLLNVFSVDLARPPEPIYFKGRTNGVQNLFLGISLLFIFKEFEHSKVHSKIYQRPVQDASS